LCYDHHDYCGRLLDDHYQYFYYFVRLPRMVSRDLFYVVVVVVVSRIPFYWAIFLYCC
jgi:hypothetical protein